MRFTKASLVLCVGIVTMILLTSSGEFSLVAAADDTAAKQGKIAAINQKYKEAFVAYYVGIVKHLFEAAKVKVEYSFDGESPKQPDQGFSFVPAYVDNPDALAKDIILLSKNEKYKKLTEQFQQVVDPDHIYASQIAEKGDIVDDLAQATIRLLSNEYEAALKESGRLYAFETFSVPRIQVYLSKSSGGPKAFGMELSESQLMEMRKKAEKQYDLICARAEKSVIAKNIVKAPVFRGLTGAVSAALTGGNVEALNWTGALELKMYPQATRNLEWNSAAEVRYSTKKEKGSAEDKNPVDVRDLRTSLTWFPTWRPGEENLEEELEFSRFFLGMQAQFRDDTIQNYQWRYVGAGIGVANKPSTTTLLVASVMGITSWNRRNIKVEDPQTPGEFLMQEQEFNKLGMTALAQLKFADGLYALDLKMEGLKPDFDDEDYFLFGSAALDYQLKNLVPVVGISLTMRGTVDYRAVPDPGKRKTDYTVTFGLKFDLGS